MAAPRSLVLPFALLLVASCSRAKTVEAPVVAVEIGGVDGGAPVSSLEPTPSPETRPDPASVVGTWEGIGRQDDGQTWPLHVEVTGTGPGLCATADYPSVPCRAEWVCLGQHGGAIVAQERLLDDSGLRCIDNGSMTLRLRPDLTLEWSWKGGGMTAESKLHRTR